MKIHLVQLNSTIGALQKNAEWMLEYYKKSAEEGADLVVFPELALCGYPPRDLLDRTVFLDQCHHFSNWLISQTTAETALLFGTAFHHQKRVGKPAVNTALLAEGGKLIGRQDKSLLPTYDVFDEHRYFDTASERQPIKWRGLRLGVTICEDIWTLESSSSGDRPYAINPIAVLKHAGIDLLLNISASPYSIGKQLSRLDVIQQTTAQLGVPVLYCNTVGGNDSLVFDGSSFALNRDGELCYSSQSFEENVLKVDLEKQEAAAPVWPDDKMQSLHDALKLGLQDYLTKCGFSEVVIGLSGGIDSALTATLAAQALGAENVHGVAMPSKYSSRHSLEDAEALANNLGIDYRVIPIKGPYDAMEATLAESFKGLEPDVAEENIQARLRGVILMALSNKFGWLLLSTGNKSEVAVGYSTLYGDSCGGLALIGDVSKTMVYQLSQWINQQSEQQLIPTSTLTKPPSAELRPGQLDSDSLPDYDLLDSVLEGYIERHESPKELADKAGCSIDLVEKIISMVDRNEYKRQQLAPCLRVTSKAFGYGRRMPIAQHFDPSIVLKS